MAVAWQATGYAPAPTLGWGLLVALFYSVIPMVIMVRGARRGRWDGHWVRERERRMVPFLLCLVSTAAGVVREVARMRGELAAAKPALAAEIAASVLGREVRQ